MISLNIINFLIKQKIATYKLDKNRKEPIKIRYEYKINDKICNIFLYFSKWISFINLYNKIPTENRHFYEIIDNNCKFFLDLDAKSCDLEIEKWNIWVNEIKNKMTSIIYKLTNKNIKIIEFESLNNKDEEKYSSHLIVKDFNLTIKQCDSLCKLIMNEMSMEKNKIIDNTIYNNWRSLRIQGCTKINSKRIKYLKNNYTDNIKIEGLITNLENTISFDSFNISFIFNTKIVKNIENNNINIYNNSINNKKYRYTINDLEFVKKNIFKLEIFINKWHKTNNNFITYKINNNIIMYKKTKPYKCNICNRIHENQNPYIYVELNNIYFDCRRSIVKKNQITNIYKNFII